MTRKNGFAYAIGLLSAAMLIMFSACSKKTQNEPEEPKTDTIPQVEETLKGNVSRPTNWVVSEDYDYTSSMTSVVKIDLQKQYPDAAKDFKLTANDLLGAFAQDGTCLGVISPDEEGFFFLYINGTEGNVKLRYWSGHYTNLFESEPFPFVNDASKGTCDEPYVPTLTVVK